MTDLLRQIAEIEGWEYCYTDDSLGPMFRKAGPITPSNSLEYVAWNPLTNDADAFTLIEKHKIFLMWLDSSSTWMAEAEVACEYDPDLRTAIVKAIVEANR